MGQKNQDQSTQRVSCLQLNNSDAAQQVTTLETMLGLIANYAPVVSCGMIVKN